MISTSSALNSPEGDAPVRGESEGEGDALETLINSTASGLAIFDAAFRLIHANPAYMELCCYSAAEAKPGVALDALIRLSLERTGAKDVEISETIRRSFERLRLSRCYSFRATVASGMNIAVERKLLDDGRMVETVRCAMDTADEVAADDRIRLFASAARTRMSHAMESMADGFALFDADDRLVAYNRQFVDLNPDIADLIAPGKSYETLLREGSARDGYIVTGIDRDEFTEWRLMQHRNPGEPYDLKMIDGRWIRVHERRTSDGGIVGIRSDITELKEREAEILRVSSALRQRNMMFYTALNNMTQGLCMFDAQQTLVVCNRRYLELYGFSSDVVKPGIKLSEIMDYSISIGNYTNEDAQRAKEARPDQARLRAQATLKQHLRDGRVIAVMHHPMKDGGSIATYEDITEKDRSEQSLKRYTRQLEVSNRELQDFAYVASHDLQEPLRKIETFGDRLTTKYANELPDGGKVYIERMQNATSRMRLLINDLLGYSRVTTKAKPFVKIDLTACVAGVIDDLQVRIEETGATVDYHGLPTIDADRTQMRQLLQNLICNALKFQKPGVAPHVSVTGQEIEPAPFSGDPDMLEIRIKDNGIGFDNKYKAQIFTIFQRLHGRNEYEGTGIGLATVRKIVERHNGTIDADGIEGKGATFIVTLPLVQKADPDNNNEDSNHA